METLGPVLFDLIPVLLATVGLVKSLNILVDGLLLSVKFIVDDLLFAVGLGLTGLI